MNTSKEQALRVLHGARDEVMQAIENDQDYELLLTGLTPYAKVVADAEGHGDMTLVLERELEL